MLVANLDGTRSVACYSLAVRQRPGIYVEILIHGDIDELWKYTQQPSLHESWDLRFTKIQYLPRASDSEPNDSTIRRASASGCKLSVRVRARGVVRRRQAGEPLH